MKSWLVVFVVVVCVAIVATHEPPPRRGPTWLDIRATQLHVGPWVADIPDGWRDLHELVKPKLPAFPVPGARTILYEGKYGGRIDVFPLTRITGDGCKAFAEMVAAQAEGQGVTITDAQGATFNGDPGCMMRINGSDSGLFLIRSNGVAGVGVRCLGEGARLDGGSACDKIIYGLRLEK
ncbi:MAG TPA: hypothetical protein VIV11_20740 [Kofleriaceae bacterium]